MARKLTKFLKKLGFVVFTAVFGFSFVVGLVLMIPSFIDWNKNSYILTNKIRDYTGYVTKFDGPVKLSVLPTPHIYMENVSMEVADTLRKEPDFFTMEALDIRLDLVALLKGQIVVNEMSVKKPSLTIELDRREIYPQRPQMQKYGRYNPDTASFLPDIAFRDLIQIEQGKFSYKDNISGEEYHVDEVNVSLEAGRITGPFVIDGSGFFKGHEAQLSLNIGELSESNRIVFSTNVLVGDLGVGGWFDGRFETDALRLVGDMSFGIEDVGLFFAGAGFPFADDYMLLVPPIDRDKLIVDDGSGEGPKVISEFEGSASITFHRNEIAFRDMKLFYVGEQGLSGDFFLTRSDDSRLNYSQLDIKVLKPFNFDPFKSTVQKYASHYFVKTAEGLSADEEEGLFIPRTLILDRTLTGSVNIEAGSFTIFDQPLQDLSIFLEIGEQQIEGHTQFLSEDGGDFDMSAKLNYAEKDINKDTGDVILSNPSMDWDIHTDLVQAPHILTNLALKTENVPLVPILVEPFKGVFTAKVKPTELGFTSHIEGLRDSDLNVQAIYQKDASYIPNRDLLTVSVINEGEVNLDSWLVGRGGENTFWDRMFGAAPVPEEGSIEDIRGEAPFPFDAVFNFSLNDVVLKGRDYNRLFLKGRLEEAHMDLEMAEVQAADETIKLDGEIEDVQTLFGIDMNFAAETKDWRALLDSWGVDLTALPFDTSAARATGTLKQGLEGVDFTANMDVLGGDLMVTGTMAGMESGFSDLKNLYVDLELPDYIHVMKAYYPSFEEVDVLDRELSIIANLVREENTYDLMDLKATIGPAQMTGELAFDFSGVRPFYEGNLDFYALPLSDMLPQSMQQMMSFQAAELSTDSDALRWSRELIPTQWMYNADFDIQLSAGDLKVSDVAMKDVFLDAKMEEGSLLLREFEADLWGGHANIQGNMSSVSPELGTIKVAGQLSLEDLDLDAQRAGLGRNFPVRRCECSFTISLAAEGSSPASLIFGMDGQGAVSGEEIVIRGFDLQNLSDVLLGEESSTKSVPQILSEVNTDGLSRFDFMSGNFSMLKGVITTDDVIWKSEIASVESSGEVNIPLWTMDIDNYIHLIGGNNKLPLEMTIAGIIDNPENSFIQSALANYFQMQMQTLLNDKFTEVERIERIKNLRTSEREAIRALKGYNHLSSN